jgi:hypothetical protein
LPAAQSVQLGLFAFGATLPGAHGVWSCEAVEHDEPSGQSVHSLGFVRPVLLENVPAGHGSSADEATGQ